MAKRTQPQARPKASPAPQTRGFAPNWLMIASAAACVVYGLVALYNLYGLARIVGYPVDVNVGEGVMLYEAKRLAAHLPIYKALDSPPYWFSTYPPLYQFLLSLGSTASFLWGRIISLGSSLWSCVALGLIVWGITRQKLPAVLAALLWITSPFTNAWSAVARVDMLGRALETGAVFVLWRWQRKSWALWASVALATLAMLTKQTLIAGGVTCAAYLWFDSRRRSVLYLGAWVAATALGYSLLSAATHGYFFRNVFLDTGRQFQWGFLFSWVEGFAESHAVMILAALGALWSLGAFPQARLFALAALAGVPGALLSANDGADVNYFFDLIWGLCGLAGISLAVAADAKPTASAPRPRVRQLASATVLLLYGLALLFVLAPMRVPSAEQYREANEITRQLKAARKPILTEFIGYGLMAGSSPDYLPYMYKKLEDQGRWNSEPIVRKIQAREYGAVLITSMAQARWGKPILEALEQAYEPRHDYSATYVVEGEEISQMLLVPAK